MIQINANSGCFCVKNSFVDKYMCEANGSFIKVYLYLLRHFGNFNLEISDIANALNIMESDVIRAFKYWQKLGVLEYKQLSDKDFKITFIDDSSDDANDDIQIKDDKQVTKATTTPTAVTYTKNDINTYMKNNDAIRHMFLISEQLLCKTLTDTERKILFSFYDYLSMPIEVIFTLLEYCISIGKTNMRYIEKVAYSWADKGINTLSKASQIVKEENELNTTLKKYKAMFKISGRDLSATEETYVKEWVYNCKFTDAEIAAAYETTVTNTGKLAFKYMDAVLRNSKNPSLYNADKPDKFITTEKKNFFQDYDSDISEYEIQLIKNRLNKM